ncbi:peroxidase mlt-7 [Patella vulgata]|uniref:peroxidase mlt-7 n=1 Tax=Patella vulgata TaxID=6465 RepID=UPI00217FC520|nr:peroxidase mlt-7 [Patella vulgata]
MRKFEIFLVVFLSCVCKYSDCLLSLDDTGVAELHRRYKRDTGSCDNTTLYRRPDGTCNNLQNSKWGSANQPHKRLIAAVYGDGKASPRSKCGNGGALPSPRVISSAVNSPRVIDDIFTVWMMQWGQFIDHDITLTPTLKSDVPCCGGNPPTGGPCFPISVPANDPYFSQFNKTCLNFIRSAPVPDSEPREQFNAITSYVDASNVYGSSMSELDSLRSKSNGMLLNNDNRLPRNPVDNCILNQSNDAYCFKAGDARVNVWPGLSTIHTIFMRLHNLIATELKQLNSSRSDEELFQNTRRIVEAINAHINYYEYLPLVLGPGQTSKYDLNKEDSHYDNSTNPSIPNSFSTAAFRFGHLQIPDKYCGQNLENFYNKTDYVIKEGITKTAQCLTEELGQKYGSHPTDAICNHLFQVAPGVSNDLIALNIQRGRDHGLPSLNDFRELACNLSRVTNFTDPKLGNSGDALSSVYSRVDDIELFPGGVAEPPVPGGIVGETFACIIGKTFSDLKKGDRFYYERNLTPDQLKEIKKISLAKVICDTTSTGQIQPNVFRETCGCNQKTDCSNIPGIDYSKFADHSAE